MVIYTLEGRCGYVRMTSFGAEHMLTSSTVKKDAHPPQGGHGGYDNEMLDDG